MASMFRRSDVHMQHFAHGLMSAKADKQPRYTPPLRACPVVIPHPPGSPVGNGPTQPTPLTTPLRSRLVQTCDMAILQTGESLRGVARLAGIDAGSLSRMMNGQTVPRYGTVVASRDRVEH